MQYAEIIIGAVCTIVGVLLSYVAFARNSKKDSKPTTKEVLDALLGVTP